MREKIVSGFYGALSWVVWTVTISGIFFLVFLLCTGHLHQPSFTVKSAVLAPAAVDDAVLLAETDDPAGWYALSLQVEIRGSAWSPYTYSTPGFELAEPGALTRCEQFVHMEEPVRFTCYNPADAALTLYIRFNGSAEELRGALAGAEFVMEEYRQELGFIGGDLARNSPYFTLSDDPETIIEFAPGQT